VPGGVVSHTTTTHRGADDDVRRPRPKQPNRVVVNKRVALQGGILGETYEHRVERDMIDQIVFEHDPM
jgi:hypothetical protein